MDSQPIPPQPEPPKRFWLKNQAGTRYAFLATVERHEARSVTLIVERVNGEAMRKGDGPQAPQALSPRPYAELTLLSHGEARIRFGTPIPVANGTDRDGYLTLDEDGFREHLRLMRWIYELWGELLPDAAGHLPELD